MADIFPGGINVLNKDPGIVGVLEMQSQARARGAQAGSQMASNFMQGRKMKHDMEMDEKKMNAQATAANQKEMISGYILNGGLPPNFSEPTEESETPDWDASGGAPGEVEGVDTTFPAGTPNSVKLQATIGRQRQQAEILRAQNARNKVAQELDLDKARVAIGDLSTRALKDGTIGTPQFKQSLFEIASRTPDVFGSDAFKNGLTQHETALKIQEAMVPQDARDTIVRQQLIKQFRDAGDEPTAMAIEGLQKMPESTPQSLAKMAQGKTEFQNLVTEATFGGDWNANDEFLPQASHIASKYPGLAATDEYKNALASREKALAAKAPDDVRKWYLLANQTQAEAEREMAAGNTENANKLRELEAGYRSKYQGQQFESDKVAERASTQVRGNLAEAIENLGTFKAHEFGFSNVGPLVPLVDVIDVGVAFGEKIPILGAGVRSTWRDIAGDPAKRGDMAARIGALERMVSSAMGYEKAVSNLEGQKIARMLQAAKVATTPEKVVAAFKAVELILTKENAREHRRALDGMDPGNQKMPALLTDTVRALQMLPKGDREGDIIKETVYDSLKRKGVRLPGE